MTCQSNGKGALVTNRATTIRRVAQTVADALGVDIEPVARGEYRPGEMRHLTSDIKRVGAAGYAPEVDLERGVERYLNWIATQGDVRDYFAAVEEVLREKRIVHRVGAPSKAVR